MATAEEIRKYLSDRLWGNVVNVYPADKYEPTPCRFCKKPNAELIAVVSLKLSNVEEPVCSDFAACEARVKKQREDELRKHAKERAYLETLEIPTKES